MNKLKQKIKDKLGEKKTAALKKAFNIARIIKNVVCWTMVAFLALAIVVFMVTKMRGDTPMVFGYSLHRIVSGSMEPTLQIGDVIINKQVTDTSDIAVGDIITFQGDSRFDKQKVTHRVLVTPYNDGEGGMLLVTKGDANNTDDGEIRFSSVESKYLIKLGLLSNIYNFFFSPLGLIVFIFLLLLIFFDEIMNIVRLISIGREHEEPETLYEIVERLQREQLEQNEGQTAQAETENNKSVKKKEKLKKNSGKKTIISGIIKKSNGKKINNSRSNKKKSSDGKFASPYSKKKRKKKKSKKRKKH